MRLTVCASCVSVVLSISTGVHGNPQHRLSSLKRDGLSLEALIVLWSRRPNSGIDIWQMVVLCAWLFDIALPAILNVARFDLASSPLVEDGDSRQWLIW